jgi:hypothetical protein
MIKFSKNSIFEQNLINISAIILVVFRHRNLEKYRSKSIDSIPAHQSLFQDLYYAGLLPRPGLCIDTGAAEGPQ